ncbi:hypothetical protein ACLOJK_039178, partial [Asimina triloba]
MWTIAGSHDLNQHKKPKPKQEPILSSVNPSSVLQSNTKASDLRNEHDTATYVPFPNMATISAVRGQTQTKQCVHHK